MKKQYHIIYGAFYRKIGIYHDGVQVHTETLWEDEADQRIDELEQQGYVRGYTKQEVECVKKQYEYFLDNLIEGE